jgi:transposase
MIERSSRQSRSGDAEGAVTCRGQIWTTVTSSQCHVSAGKTGTAVLCALACVQGGAMATNRSFDVAQPPTRSKRYPSDVDDQEWAIIAPYIAQKPGSRKKRTVDMREILNAMLYRARTGCQWRMLPIDFPPWYHVWYYYRIWRDDGTWKRINNILRRSARTVTERDREPGTAIAGGQTREKDKDRRRKRF